MPFMASGLFHRLAPLAALAEIERLQPAIALLDLGLSDLAVTEVIRRVRKRICGLAAPCFLFEGPQNRARGTRTGACGFLLKTSTPDRCRTHSASSRRAASTCRRRSKSFRFSASRAAGTEDPLESLSSREFQVFSLLVEGVRAKEIAARLALSPKTVDTYRSSLMRKLDIHDVAGLVKFAIRRDLADVRA